MFKSISNLIAAIAMMAAVFAGSASAHAEKVFGVKASVRDAGDNTVITDATYRMLQLPDSAEVRHGDAFTTYYRYEGDHLKEGYTNNFGVRELPISGVYLLELSCPGYETLYVDVDPANIPKKSYDLDLGTLRLSKVKMLREVSVTATKVKFYNKGDTVVYNADAFVLAEGSMLDALIAQLPGAEIRSGGQIYVNGRYVESLLLNGKDFFKGNNEIMLENLGAYTVKNIEVYDGQEEMDRIMGKDYGKKIYTMNVKLKKEYNVGFLLNAEGGLWNQGQVSWPPFRHVLQQSEPNIILWQRQQHQLSVEARPREFGAVAQPGER